MNRLIEFLVKGVLSIAFISFVVIALVDIEGPGAPAFFSRHPVFRVVYAITHIGPFDGLFFINLD